MAKFTPQPHQERLADKLLDSQSKGQIAFHGLGSGKTYASIVAAEKANLPITAVVPASLRENYKKELKAAKFKGKANVLSYEQATKLMDDPEFKASVKDSMLVFDEAHRMGRSESKRSELASKLEAKKKLHLTGSPIRNHPHELSPLINSLRPGALPTNKDEFDATFIEDQEIQPGFWGKLKGAKPGIHRRLKDTAAFQKATQGLVDSHPSGSSEHFPEVTEEDVDVEMSPVQRRAYSAIMKGQPDLAYKIRYGVPPGKGDFGRYKSFLLGLRQVSNTAQDFAKRPGDDPSPKISKAVDEIHSRHSKNKDFRGVAYSNFISSGLVPMKKSLQEKGIKAEIYSGSLTDKKKKELVERYNNGELPMLLVSGAGAEGLDLKGTRYMGLLEPHWNNARTDQVIGRGARHKSHSHLPEGDRKMHIQRFTSTVPPTLMQKLRKKKPHQSADQTLKRMSNEKSQLNDQFLKALTGDA